ncbi:MAG: SEC-C domain-containing protein [Thiobacillus sp.]|nr:SEC-C domain-containing protein [Thiobacillus sp.]
MEDFDIDEDGSAADELGFLFDSAARRILSDESPEGFVAWFQLAAPQFAPLFMRRLPDDAAFRRGFLTQFARIIWNKTPLPGNRFQPRPIPKSERNQACLCGSGKKYKHCCHALEGLEQGLPEFSMLLHVLETVPVKQFVELPFSHLNLDELAYVANAWMSNGSAREAAKLLEGLFVDCTKLDDRAEPALYCLLDCYERLNNPLKKKRLLQRAMAAPDKALRAAAIQRQCTIHADRGEYDLAWALFQQAQRLAPDDSSLSHLEILILNSQGEHARARERAAFWIARLSKDKTGQYANLIAFLRDATDDPGGSMLNILQENHPALQQCADLMARLPPAACHYRLDMDAQDAGPLEPDPTLRRLHAQWARYARVLGETSPAINWDARLPWLAWLEKNPVAWQSFDVLLDIVQALRDTEPRLTGMETEMVLPLLQRAEALLRLVLKQHRAEGRRLEWGWHENRPALSLLASLAFYHVEHDDLARAVDLLEWCVLTLNPNDNQGLRDPLIHLYLCVNRIDDALDLAARYPDDLPAMQYGGILALYMAGKIEAAARQLKQTARAYPEIARMLLSAAPRRPALNPGYSTLGGKDEAWYYREDNLDVWQQSGGLAWLRQALPKQPARNRK